MEEKPEQQAPSDSDTIKSLQPKLCEECKKNPSKYRCPGCSMRTCSLPCVNSHKLRTSCTGKRPATKFVPISQFDDNLLISDYTMLEDVKRIADSAQRMRVKVCGYSHWLPPRLINLRRAAASRRTKLLFLANGMSKRDMNKTYYNYRKKFISWTIEWRFHSTDVVLVDHGVHENSTPTSAIEKHLKPGPWAHPLRQFCDLSLDSLKCFIRKYPKGQKSPYRQLNMNAPIREQLANIVVLEFPVIHVFLPSHSAEFEVINDIIPSKIEIKKLAQHDSPPSHKGVTFREEEIEDRGSLEPHVSDLTNHAAYEKKEIEEKPKEFVWSPKGVKRARLDFDGDSGIMGRDACIEQLADIDFDFEPGSMDVYLDLTADTNPDNFLDFNGILAEDHNEPDGGAFIMENELEEGEIA